MCSPGPTQYIFYMPMTHYSLFVLKVSLNSNHPTNLVVWVEADPKTAFFAFLGYPSTIRHTAYRKHFYPNQWYRWKSETLKVCLLLVWRFFD